MPPDASASGEKEICWLDQHLILAHSLAIWIEVCLHFHIAFADRHVSSLKEARLWGTVGHCWAHVPGVQVSICGDKQMQGQTSLCQCTMALRHILCHHMLELQHLCSEDVLYAEEKRFTNELSQLLETAARMLALLWIHCKGSG